MNIEEILLWLFIVNLGIAVGAGLYEIRVVVPIWLSSPPESLRSPDSGLRFWAYAATVTLTALGIANLIIAWKVEGSRHDWWLIASILLLVERLMTFTYFIPTLIKLQKSTAPSAEVRAGAVQWARFNYVRNLVTLIAWLAAMKVLSMS